MNARGMIYFPRQCGAPTPEIDDWLRGRDRVTSTTANAVGSLLSSVGNTATTCVEASPEAEGIGDPHMSSHLRRICGRVRSAAGRGAGCMDVARVLAAPAASAMEIIGMVATLRRAGK
jgi:hypothetical protein